MSESNAGAGITITGTNLPPLNNSISSCPHCGYCPTCGRPRSWYIPPVPYQYPYHPGYAGDTIYPQFQTWC